MLAVLKMFFFFDPDFLLNTRHAACRQPFRVGVGLRDGMLNRVTRLHGPQHGCNYRPLASGPYSQMWPAHETCTRRQVVQVRHSGRADQSGRWVVDGSKSEFHHNHGRHPSILADPEWRPARPHMPAADETEARNVKSLPVTALAVSGAHSTFVPGCSVQE